MSVTASAECCTPSPRLSSANRLICDSLKNGRNGSLLANFTPETGSHITTDFSPEPCSRPVGVTVATSLVWNAISQNGSKPSTCCIQSRAGFIVWKFAVR